LSTLFTLSQYIFDSFALFPFIFIFILASPTKQPDLGRHGLHKPPHSCHFDYSASTALQQGSADPLLSPKQKPSYTHPRLAVQSLQTQSFNKPPTIPISQSFNQYPLLPTSHSRLRTPTQESLIATLNSLLDISSSSICGLSNLKLG
jgi:hypothetical protein